MGTDLGPLPFGARHKCAMGLNTKLGLSTAQASLATDDR